MAVEDTSSRDVELVVDHGGAVMHPTLLQILTFDKFVALGVVGYHSSGIA